MLLNNDTIVTVGWLNHLTGLVKARPSLEWRVRCPTMQRRRNWWRRFRNMRNHILAALEQSAWVIDGPRGAAKILGLHPNTLRSRMKKLGIVRAPPIAEP